MAKIDAFFKLMNEQGASDLHLASGQPPALRVRGEIERVKFKVLDSDDLRGMLYEIAPEQKIKMFEESGDIDFGYEIPGLARYRANFFMQRNGVAAVFREIPSAIMTADQLGLPPVVSKLATLPRGLVLVTGPTGSGKSTTLAAIVESKTRLNLCIKARVASLIIVRWAFIRIRFQRPCAVPCVRIRTLSWWGK
jgi:twitching motility protein PilT